MVSREYDLRRVGVALLVATSVSIAVILLGQVLGLSESAADRMSTIVFFPGFLGVCNAARRGPVATS